MDYPDSSRLRELVSRFSAADPAEAASVLGVLDLRSPALDAKLAGLPKVAPGAETWGEEEVFSDAGARASLFLVPRGGVLPLHDHPGMTVLLRIVAGRFSVRSYDWADPPGSGLARPVGEFVLAAGDPVQVLFPNRGNLHRIEALEDGAFLDLFSPYYCEEEGRPCTYYREEGSVEADGETLVRLVGIPRRKPAVPD